MSKKRTISKSHQKALQKGKAAKAAERAKTRNQRVAAWRAWNRRDADRYYKFRTGDINREEWRRLCRDDPEPESPSDDDFKIVDGRMAEKEALPA